jgi:hypothetical protein
VGEFPRSVFLGSLALVGHRKHGEHQGLFGLILELNVVGSAYLLSLKKS